MTTKIINRRETDPHDEERHARRRSIREQAARRDLELQPAILAEADVRASEARCDELAEQHAMATAPWQSELQELEQAAISRIGKREPANVDEDARRTELQSLIATATTDLEKAITAERELQATLRRKARLCRQGRPPSDVLLMKLAQPPLASPKLLAELHVSKQRVMWLDARRKAAEKSLATNRFNVEEIAAGRSFGDSAVYHGKVQAWQAELSAASQELADALAESERIHQRLLDE